MRHIADLEVADRKCHIINSYFFYRSFISVLAQSLLYSHKILKYSVVYNGKRPSDLFTPLSHLSLSQLIGKVKRTKS